MRKLFAVVLTLSLMLSMVPLTALADDGDYPGGYPFEHIYSVVFELNGGERTGGGELYQGSDTSFTVVYPEFEREGYLFDGWTRTGWVTYEGGYQRDIYSARWFDLAANFDGGDGSAEAPFLLSTPEQMMALTAALSSAEFIDGVWKYPGIYSSAETFLSTCHYKLLNDIDLDGYIWLPFGSSTSSIFWGEFDGNGKTVSNVRTATETQYQYPMGFFVMLAGKVYDLTLENVYIEGRSGGGTGFGTGGVAGILYAPSYNSATLTYKGVTYTGNGAIINCHVTGTIINTYSSGAYSSAAKTGGLAGDSYGGFISDSSFVGDIQTEGMSPTGVGGLVGGAERYTNTSNYSDHAHILTIENCYSSGTISWPAGNPYGSNVGKILGVMMGYNGREAILNYMAAGELVFTNVTSFMTLLGERPDTNGYDGIEIAPPCQHVEVTETVAATCTEDGYIKVTCEICGEELSYTVIPATGHVEVPERVEPTYEADGYIKVTCSVCGEELSYTVLPKLEAPVTLVSTFASAFVTKKSGSQNDLTITITQLYSDDSTNEIVQTIGIKNNASDYYEVGEYLVYVGTTGNDKISGIRLYKLLFDAAA